MDEKKPYDPDFKTKEQKKAIRKDDIHTVISIVFVIALWIWLGLHV